MSLTSQLSRFINSTPSGHPMDGHPTGKTEALTAWRAAVTDTTYDMTQPHSELEWQTPLETAVLCAIGEVVDPDSAYEPAQGRDDLATILQGKTQLGPVTPDGSRHSLLNIALKANDPVTSKMLLAAGATWLPHENPVTAVVTGGTVDFGDPKARDLDRMKQCLIELQASGHDINQDIDGRPASVSVALELLKRSRQSLNNPNTTAIMRDFYADTPGAIRATAEAGIDYTARDKDGVSTASSVRSACLAELGAPFKQEENQALNDAHRISREISVMGKARAIIAKRAADQAAAKARIAASDRDSQR